MTCSAPFLNLLAQDEDNVEALDKMLNMMPNLLCHFTCTGSSLLHCCTLTEKPKSIALLLSNGFNVDCLNDFAETPLHWVAKSGTLKNYSVLEMYGANTNALDNDGNSPLHWACESGNVEIIKKLIKNPNTDPNLKNLEGLAPIDVAALHGDYEVTKILLQHGVPVTEKLMKNALLSENKELIIAIKGML